MKRSPSKEMLDLHAAKEGMGLPGGIGSFSLLGSPSRNGSSKNGSAKGGGSTKNGSISRTGDRATSPAPSSHASRPASRPSSPRQPQPQDFWAASPPPPPGPTPPPPTPPPRLVLTPPPAGVTRPDAQVSQP